VTGAAEPEAVVESTVVVGSVVVEAVVVEAVELLELLNSDAMTDSRPP